VATRSAKRYAGDDDARHTFAAVGLLHDVLEDSPDPLAAAMEIANYFVNDPEAAEAVRLLTRTTRDTDATYFDRMNRGGNIVAFLVKIEDAKDNLADSKGAFKPARRRKFAMKTAIYVMPLVARYSPALFPVMAEMLIAAMADEG
jgi:(p)ppGpp synthase/HD superfamily hydrolase